MGSLKALVEKVLEQDGDGGLEPVEESSINSVYRDSSGNFVKKFGGIPFEAINNYFSGRSIRLETSSIRKDKELNSVRHLKEAGFNVPSTREQGSRTLNKDAAPGQDFSDYLQEKPLDDVYKAAREFGTHLRSLHDAGHAFQDPAPRNFTVEKTEDEDYEFWAIDSEFFLEGCEVGKKYDLRSIDKKAKTMERERYLTTMLGIEEGYKTDKETTRASIYAVPPTGNISNYLFNTAAERF